VHLVLDNCAMSHTDFRHVQWRSRAELIANTVFYCLPSFRSVWPLTFRMHRLHNLEFGDARYHLGFSICKGRLSWQRFSFRFRLHLV
jgi:hypothetical protein